MKLLYGIAIVLFVACSSSGGNAPEGILDRERFKQTLLEAQLIEARMNHELIIAHLSEIPGEQYYADMFKVQGTTKEEFTKSFAYYSERPEEMRAIYEEIFTELSRRKDEQPQ